MIYPELVNIFRRYILVVSLYTFFATVLPSTFGTSWCNGFGGGFDPFCEWGKPLADWVNEITGVAVKK